MHQRTVRWNHHDNGPLARLLGDPLVLHKRSNQSLACVPKFHLTDSHCHTKNVILKNCFIIFKESYSKRKVAVVKRYLKTGSGDESKRQRADHNCQTWPMMSSYEDDILPFLLWSLLIYSSPLKIRTSACTCWRGGLGPACKKYFCFVRGGMFASMQETCQSKQKLSKNMLFVIPQIKRLLENECYNL